MDEETTLGKARAEELAAANELNLKRYMEVEGKYEQLLLAKERASSELKMQREASMKEVELLKSSETFLRKSLDNMTCNYNSLLDDLLELKVAPCYQINYDELLFKLDEYRKTIRELGENSAIKSKQARDLKSTASDLEQEVADLRQSNYKLELQLCEQSMAFEESLTLNKTLEIERKSSSTIIQNALTTIATHLSSRMTVDDLTKVAMEENQTLKAEKESLENRLLLMESHLRGAEDRLLELTKIQSHQDSVRSVLHDSRVTIADISTEFEHRLNKLIEEREIALAEAIACSPNDTLVRKNKQLTEDIERTSTENMLLRSEINDLRLGLKHEKDRNEALAREVI